MKTFKLILAVVLIGAFSTTIYAENSANTSGQQKTESLRVWGNCDMCKTRIEKTVRAAGATSASWDTKIKILTVSFNPSKLSADSLAKKLASAGHDTEKYKAPDDAYAKLPGCCHYERIK